MAAKPESSTEDRGKTPPTWSTPKDAREESGEYPNYSVRKTRSGHVLMFDDTKDKEHLTFQHRSGSMLQFLPDGAIQSVANKGRFDTTFGEFRSKVTGAQDTTVDGGSSTMTKGDVNTTTYGNSVQAVNGNQSTAIAGSMGIMAGGQVGIVAPTFNGKFTNATLETGGNLNFKAGSILALVTPGTGGIKAAQGAGITSEEIAAMEAPKIGANVPGGASFAMIGREIHFNGSTKVKVADIPNVSVKPSTTV